MYLKSVDIQGFKSFAEKVSLGFGSGITSIVGPNGSGKSNIADAVRWVLGEQSAKTLRGSKMEDVIFSGTEHRKPLGFSEVSLTIDNSDGKLPLEYNEVTVTRRVFRSGESEFFINKSACRLKDIQELFMDTGIGKDGYSVISQGRVDDILSNRSEDRRNIFEEASGIMKYKTRKTQAERKLDATKQNLVRINDIINELQIQLEPLREQSETAKKYLDFREMLKEIEVNLYIMSIAKYREKLSEYDSQINTINGNISDENMALEKIKSGTREKSQELSGLEEKLESARKHFYDLEGDIEKCESEIKVNNEKINSLLSGIGRSDEEITETKVKLDEIAEENEKKLLKLNYLNGEFEKYTVKLLKYEADMEALLSTLGSAEREVEKMSSEVDEKNELLSDMKIRINSASMQIDALEKRSKEIESEVYKSKIEAEREKMQREDLTELLYKTRKNIKELSESLELMNKSKSIDETNLSSMRTRQNNLKSELQVKQQRAEMLEEMENRMEGYSRSVKSILAVSGSGIMAGKGICGALGQLIKVDKEYETALEMVLGGALQNIVTDDEENAKQAIEYLKKNRLGRATFLPVTAVKARSLDDNTHNRLNNENGFINAASELVKCDEKYKGIVANLLGTTAVVNNIDAGIRIAKSFSYKFRIVTLEGDVINTSGAMTGGSTESSATGILGRKREIESLKTVLVALKSEYVQITGDIENLVKKINITNKSIEEAGTELKNNELIKIRDESHAASIDEDIEKLNAKADMLEQESVQLARQKGAITSELAICAKEAEEIQSAISKIKTTISENQEKQKEGRSQRDALHADITDHKISVNSIKENIDAVKEMMEKLSQDKELLISQVDKKQYSSTKAYEQIETLKEKNDAVREVIKKHIEEKSGKTFEIEKYNVARKVFTEEQESDTEKIEEKNNNILILKDEIAKAEVRKAKIEAETDAVQNKLWDDYELTYSNAMAYKKEIGSITSTQKRVDELKMNIRELGPINIAAIEDYSKTKERHGFMTAQRDDMQSAEGKLQDIIIEMTSIMKKQFLQQFNLINRNFNTVFKELFDGGTAELILSDTANLLESPIEIEVQPPGKKLQNMMLLSGGERALTAIALVFAILRLNPAPFCVLDEIEAALDDSNVYKFADYLKKYSKESQFVMITHRKGTMEVSDTIYGVTMEERGISKVVSMKMEERNNIN